MSIPKNLRKAYYANQKILRFLKKTSIHCGLRKLGLKNAGKIHTFTTVDELIQLHEIAVACPQKANVVEIGSYLGASTSYIAGGLSGKKAIIYCIDTWQNETMPDGIKDTYKAFSNNLAKSTQEIIKIRKKSDEVTATDLPDHVDFAFIDGDHSFKSAQNDVQLLEPLMAKNSVLAFHDALYFQGVSQIIGDVLKRGNWRLEGQVNNLVWLRKHQFEQ